MRREGTDHCQLKAFLAEADRRTPWMERTRLLCAKCWRRLGGIVERRIENMNRRVGRLKARFLESARVVGQQPKQEQSSWVLALKPGEHVRIKSWEQIQRTLDEDGMCEHMAYAAAAMNKYCGGTYQVLKRVERFYDERQGRLVRPRHTVVLDRVYCDGSQFGKVKGVGGCDRACLLFWKEAWLERFPGEADVQGER